MDSFSLTADMMYVSTNAPRIARAVFEIALRRGWSGTAELALRLCKVWEMLRRCAECRHDHARPTSRNSLPDGAVDHVHQQVTSNMMLSVDVRT